MRALVVYDTVYGNTEQIAWAIASGLSPADTVEVRRASDVESGDMDSIGLLVVGGPTQKRHATAELRRFLEALPRRSLRGVSAAAFDTRYPMSRFLSGSAAVEASRLLRRAGASLLCEPESFFMERDQPPEGQRRRHELERLEAGEIGRARAWGSALIATELSKVG